MSNEAAVHEVIAHQEQESREFLESSVIPVLVQGLDALCRDRPENPVDFLAMYLLKRTTKKNITVEVPLSATIPQEQQRTL